MRKVSTVLTATFIFLASLALAHEGHKHVMGTVAAVAADHLQVKTKDGKAVTVPLTKTTRYIKGKVKATPADIHVGDRVVVDLAKGGAAEEVRLPAGKAMSAGLRKVEELKKVCMVTNQVFEKDQIPVAVKGRTYYGCCEGCKQTLTNNPAARAAVDPVSGKKVDKATAVVGARPDGSVLYFENAVNLEKYSSRPKG